MKHGKGIRIWQRFTQVKPDKQGVAIFLYLDGKAWEAVVEITMINDKNGVDKFLLN